MTCAETQWTIEVVRVSPTRTVRFLRWSWTYGELWEWGAYAPGAKYRDMVGTEKTKAGAVRAARDYARSVQHARETRASTRDVICVEPSEL